MKTYSQTSPSPRLSLSASFDLSFVSEMVSPYAAHANTITVIILPLRSTWLPQNGIPHIVSASSSCSSFYFARTRHRPQLSPRLVLPLEPHYVVHDDCIVSETKRSRPRAAPPKKRVTHRVLHCTHKLEQQNSSTWNYIEVAFATQQGRVA